MPIEYAIDGGHRQVLSKVEGTLTPAQLAWHMERLASDPGAPSPLHELMDISEVGRLDLSFVDLIELVDMPVVVLAEVRSRFAVVAPRDDVFGVGRMVETLSGPTPFTVRSFRELEPARQ